MRAMESGNVAPAERPFEEGLRKSVADALAPWRGLKQKLDDRRAAMENGRALAGGASTGSAPPDAPSGDLGGFASELTYSVYTVRNLEGERAPRQARTIDSGPELWRRVLVAGAVVVMTLAAFCFAVLTVAELTDDLKPKRATTAMRFSAPSTATTPAPIAPVVAQPIATVAPPPALTAWPEPKATKKRRGAGKAKGKRSVEPFVP